MENPVTWILDQIRRLNDIIWNTSLSEISKRKSFILKQMRILVLAARGFLNDKVQLRASALTFYSLLSIIPMAAIVFAIAKGFDVDNNIKIIIQEKFQSQAAN
jgi:membrane protein